MSILKVSNLGKTYWDSSEGSHTLFSSFSYCFPNSGIVGILGSSGCGKSTLLNILTGLEVPSTGKVLYKKKDLRDFSEKDKNNFYSSEISFIFQHFNLIDDLKVLDNLSITLLNKGNSRRKANKISLSVLKELHIEYLKDKKPSQISGGEKQRVALARAIVSDSKIVVADEPTGALDIENAKFLMDQLKELAKEKLIIIVSHNETLIDEYSDVILQIEGGRVRVIRENKQVLTSTNIQKNKLKKKSKNVENVFIGLNFKRHLSRNLICFVSGLIGYLSLLICLGFFSGSKNSIMSEKKRFLDYQVSYLYKEEKIELKNSPLRLVQQIRPTLEEATSLLSKYDVSIKNDLSLFIPSNAGFSLNGEKQDPCSFRCIKEVSNLKNLSSLIVKGEEINEENLKYVYVNEEFIKKYGKESLDGEIFFSNECEIDYEGIKETINLNFTFSIAGVVSEMSFLNTPKIFYSYTKLLEYLNSIELNNIADKLGISISIEELLFSKSGEDALTNYNYLAFINEFSDVERIYSDNGIKESNVQINNLNNQISTSFESLNFSFTATLVLFVIIGIVGLILLLGINGFSSFVFHQKESAVLKILGTPLDNIFSIYLVESVFISMLSFTLSMALSFPASSLFNRYLWFKTGIQNLVEIPYKNYLNIPYIVIVGGLLISILIGVFSVYIPLIKFRKDRLVEELRDE
ncbi:MAG: ATP-binding cassette domain-containing protein [Bacilli bacterium]|nr:ATP-binding cassette domain-containing protein [Bacilli bacterium]MDY6430799.1 ATP-binding cassette domain-containing protein [Bacilli bacterium]